MNEHVEFTVKVSEMEQFFYVKIVPGSTVTVYSSQSFVARTWLVLLFPRGGHSGV